MNPIDISNASDEQLTDAYTRAAFGHGSATRNGDHEAANRHHDAITAIYRELRVRGGRAQSALVPLMQHGDECVRSWSAAHALEFAPEQAEPVLTELAAGQGFAAFNAKMTLREWRKGRLSFP